MDKRDGLDLICTLIELVPIYILILDKDFKIKVINPKLAEDLTGARESCIEMNEKNLLWKDYLSSEDLKVFEQAHYSLMNKIETQITTQSFITTYKNETVFVKWFLSHINTDLNWIFCIGVPESVMYKGLDNFTDDEKREFYKKQVERDRAFVSAVKEIALRYSDKLLKKGDISEGSDMQVLQSEEV